MNKEKERNQGQDNFADISLNKILNRSSQDEKNENLGYAANLVNEIEEKNKKQLKKSKIILLIIFGVLVLFAIGLLFWQ